MTNNCLVTKLKSVVANDNLVKINELRLHVQQLNSITHANQQTLKITYSSVSTGDNPKITVRGNGAIATSLAGLNTNPLTEYTFTSTSPVTLYLKNANYDLSITHKYDIQNIGPEFSHYHPLVQISSDDIKFMENLWYIRLCGQTTRIDNIKDALYIPGLRVFQANDTNYSGNIVEDFGNCSQYLYEIVVNGSNASGTLENLASKMVLLGKTSGSISVSAFDSNVTYQESQLSSQNYIINFNPEYTGGYQITIA